MELVRNLIAGILVLIAGSSANTAELFEDFPQYIHADEKYVFYSHGLIVEGNNSRPIHSDYGAYEFSLIKQEIFRGGDFNLIAHHRPENTDPEEYSDKMVSWVAQLIEAGVRPENITLVGFSRGAQITAKAAGTLSQSGINTVLMAVCFNGDYPTMALGGHVLSIYETSDVVKSCSKLLERSERAISAREIAISTGLAHGAFYSPQPEWLNPLKAWLRENDR